MDRTKHQKREMGSSNPMHCNQVRSFPLSLLVNVTRKRFVISSLSRVHMDYARFMPRGPFYAALLARDFGMSFAY